MIVCADAMAMPLGDNSVQCVVTSPPYWGLRKYAGEQELVWLPAGCQQCFGTGLQWFVDGRWVSDEDERGPFGFTDLRFCADCKGCEHDWAAQVKVGGGKSNGKERWNHTGHGEHGHAQAETNTCRKCGAWRGAYGLEPTVEMYVQHTVEILREIRRVLRGDGVVFWNLGDSYHNGDKGGYTKDRVKAEDYLQRSNLGANFIGAPNRQPQAGLKPKDLCLIPQRVALAAQADGWWVRSDIIWAKPNPMPESCQDRPTDAYEHILMLTKSARYYWDAEAVKEPAEYGRRDGGFRGGGGAYFENQGYDGRVEKAAGTVSGAYPETGRNLRNVWHFATQPYKGAHFATFPEELPRRCIRAATSERGRCAACGTPWERVVERPPNPSKGMNTGVDRTGGAPNMGGNRNTSAGMHRHGTNVSLAHLAETIGWRPGCECRGQHGRTVPCLVLDPFGGSGTTGRVAIELGRRAVLLDLAYNPAAEKHYAELGRKRTSKVQRELISR